MMNYSTPEKCGIPTAAIKKYVEHLEANNLSTHSLIIARGNDIVFEKYWAPFHKEFKHRLYSVTKSFVALALGFLQDEGKISLDDPISKYFPEETANIECDEIRSQTLRHMLMMSTSMQKAGGNWFADRTSDRVRNYFRNVGIQYPHGTVFGYDSTGSFVLGALAERVSGKSLVDYLDEKMFSHIGACGVESLLCPGGHSWSDSAFLMRPIDLMRSARFVMNGGSWDGKQLLSLDFVKEATSPLVSTDVFGFGSFEQQGYGYLIWRTKHNSFFFNGMGCQFAVCMPDKDLIFVYNGDNQGNDIAKDIIVDEFFDLIARPAIEGELPENTSALASLDQYAKSLKLYAVKSDIGRDFEKKVNGKTFKLNENPMGISEITFDFSDGVCEMNYVNAQGAKTLYFRINENEFGIFPEEGYSDEIGSQFAKGHYLKCAASAAWIEPQKLFVRVQVIDNYFGILNMNFGFKDENTVGIYMDKTAEDFFNTYRGFATGTAK